MPLTRYATDSVGTALPVNCLLRLPIPTAPSTASSSSTVEYPVVGPYGPLPTDLLGPSAGGNGGDRSSSDSSEVVMIGCYKHDAATETYSGAVRVTRVLKGHSANGGSSPLSSPSALSILSSAAIAAAVEKNVTAGGETYSTSASSSNGARGVAPAVAETLCDVPLPDFGVFDLCLVGTIGGDASGMADEDSGSLLSTAPNAAASKLFPQAFVRDLAKALSSSTSDDGDGGGGAARSIVYIVAAPCTDGHLRLFAIRCVSGNSADHPLAATVHVIVDLPVAEPMLTSVAIFPQRQCAAAEEGDAVTMRAVCSSHGGEMHLITARLMVNEAFSLAAAAATAEESSSSSCAPSRTMTILASTVPVMVLRRGSSAASPSYTHFSWEGHEYDSWCVCRDPLDPFNVFWSGGDDGKLKRWVLDASKWAILEKNADGEDADEDLNCKPSLGFTKIYEAGVVTIAPLFVHSAREKFTTGDSASSSSTSSCGALFTSSYLVVGSYDENLRVYHLSNADALPAAAAAGAGGDGYDAGATESSARAALGPLPWKRLMETPLFEVPCEGGAWRCRVPPPHDYLHATAAMGKSDSAADGSFSSLYVAAHHSEHTNVLESHVFVSSAEKNGEEVLAPLSVAAMQRGGAVVFAPLPRYHALQQKALTASADGSSVSSAIPLNDELIDEFAIDTDESVLFLEKLPIDGAEKKEPLIYDVCPVGVARSQQDQSSFGLSQVLACSFYDKEILGFVM